MVYWGKIEEGNYMKLDFTNNATAQDMISIIMRDKGLSVEEAVSFAITREMHQEILKKGYASIALGVWDHEDPEEQWGTLSNPVFEVELSKLQGRLIEDVAERQRIDEQTAVCYFLIFALEALGYHI